MKIYLNGDLIELVQSCSLSELLSQYRLAGKRLAIEVNHEVIPRSQHAIHILQPNDKVEIIHAIGGG